MMVPVAAPLQAVPASIRPATTVAVASGKGGAGKTWFAITLAHALARRGDRVLLVDGDLGLANVDIQLGLTPQYDLGDVVSGAASLDAAILAGPGGFDILAGRSGCGALSALSAGAVEQVLASLGSLVGRHDWVVLDLGAGLDRAVRRMAAWADILLVVATEEPTSLTDAYATLKLHAADRPGADARIIVNQASSQAAGERTYATLSRACAAYLGRAPALAGMVRRDTRVPDAIRRQALLLTRHPNALAGLDVEQIALQLSAGPGVSPLARAC